MFGSEFLEVAIGIIFIYLLISIICSAVREGIEALLKTRSAYLEHGIRELLHDRDGNGLARSFFGHPLIYSLFLDEYRPRPSPRRPWPWARSRRPSFLAKGTSLPSYIPARSFAIALMDLAARGPANDPVASDPGSPVISLVSLRENVQNLRNEGVQRALLTAIDSAQGDLNRVQENLEAWYDSAMDRVSGWYKRSTQWVIFWIGLFVAIAMNVNTVTIADYLYRNDATRQALVARAETAARDSGTLRLEYAQARAALDSLELPIGWNVPRPVPREVDEPLERAWFFVGIPIVGWLMTALAASMGAPFWFDVLNKVMVIRSTVKPHEKSPDEGSEDRQPRTRIQAPPPAPPPVPPPVQPDGGGGEPRAPGGGNQPVPGTAPAGPVVVDAESHVDACDLEIEDETRDEDLPPAEGGVG